MLFINKFKKYDFFEKEIHGIPWMSEKAIRWLDSFLSKDMVVFEYGSGGSTIYIANRVKKIFSVEHKIHWYLKLKYTLYKNTINNCKIYCIEPKIKDEKNFLYRSGDPELKKYSFKKYVKKINKFPDNYFDLIIIDGRARNGCVINALKKVKNSGYILLDDSDRAEYNFGVNKLNKYKNTKFVCFNPDTETKIWKIKK